MLASSLQSPAVTVLVGIGGKSPTEPGGSLGWKVKVTSKRFKMILQAKLWAMTPRDDCVQNLSTTATTQAADPAHP